MGVENAILTNLNADDCRQTTTNEKPIYFPTNSCKLQNRMSSSKIRSLKSALLGKVHALLQNVLTCSPISNDGIARARPNKYLSFRLRHGLFALVFYEKFLSKWYEHSSFGPEVVSLCITWLKGF